MTKRHLAISLAILEYLHELDGGQADTLLIHKGASEKFMALIPKNEFDEVFESLNREGCFIGVQTRFKGTKWSLSDKGEQTRQEMRS
jgi:hypothetical protein